MSALLLLRAVTAAGLLAVADTLGVQRTADDLVTNTRQVLHTTAAHQHVRVLLEVVADPGNVGGHLDAIGEPHTGHLAERRVRLLGGGGVDARADTAPLRAPLERRGLGLTDLCLAALADQLLNRGHRVSVRAFAGSSFLCFRRCCRCRDLQVCGLPRPPRSGVSRQLPTRLNRDLSSGGGTHGARRSRQTAASARMRAHELTGTKETPTPGFASRQNDGIRVDPAVLWFTAGALEALNGHRTLWARVKCSGTPPLPHAFARNPPAYKWRHPDNGTPPPAKIAEIRAARAAGASRGPGGTAAARVPAPRRQRHLYKDVCKRERPALWQGRAFRTPSPNPGGPAHGSAVVLTEVVLLQRHGPAGADRKSGGEGK